VAVQPFARGPIFRDQPSSGPARSRRHQVRAVEQLLGVHERMVEVQAASLEQAHQRELMRSQQLRTLADATVLVSRARSLDEILRLVTEQARRIIGASQASAGLTADGDPAAGSEVSAMVCETNLPLRADGWLGAPLISRTGQNMGLLQLSERHEGAFTSDDEAILVQLAQIASVTVENALAYAREHDLATALQHSLLPDALPDVPGWCFAADYRPGQRGAEVGGDFYDVFAVEGGHMVLLGDVTGKGVTAAALTSLVRHTARTAAAFDPRPSAVLALVNRALRQRPKLAPVTMLCGLLHGDQLTLAIGGHPHPLLKRGQPTCETVGVTGLLLGAVQDYADAEDVTVALLPGDTLLLYTDGVTETPGAADRFGEERLRTVVDDAPPDPEGLLAAVSAALDAFARGTVLDDRAMLVLHRTGPSTEAG